MAGDILIGKALYTATLPLFGVLEVSSKPVEANQTISTNEDDSVAHVFKWSPLYVHPKAGMDNNEPSYSTMNLSQVRKRFGDWVTRLVAGIGTVSLERFYNLERDRHRQVCANQLFKGIKHDLDP